MKDILERLDESLVKKEEPKEIVQELVGALAAGAALVGGIAGAAKIMSKLSGNTKVATDIFTKIIKPNKAKIGSAILAAHKDNPKFAMKSIGLFSALKSVKDPKTRKDLAGLFFIFLVKHNEKSSIFGKKGMGTLTRSRDKDIAQGAKEALNDIKKQMGS